MKHQSGFTLIEIMIVVAIIAILAGILIPNFTHARAQAQTAACESNLREIGTAMELYYTDHQQYPNNTGATVQVDGTAASGLQDELNNVPHDPAGLPGATYSYVAASGSTPSYAITCPGVHDPKTLQSVTPNTSNTKITYSSGAGLGTGT